MKGASSPLNKYVYVTRCYGKDTAALRERVLTGDSDMSVVDCTCFAVIYICLNIEILKSIRKNKLISYSVVYRTTDIICIIKAEYTYNQGTLLIAIF